MRDDCDGEDFCLPMMVALELIIGPAGRRVAMAGRCDGEDCGAAGVRLKSRDGERPRSIDSEGEPRGKDIGFLNVGLVGGKRDGEGTADVGCTKQNRIHIYIIYYLEKSVIKVYSCILKWQSVTQMHAITLSLLTLQFWVQSLIKDRRTWNIGERP